MSGARPKPVLVLVFASLTCVPLLPAAQHPQPKTRHTASRKAAPQLVPPPAPTPPPPPTPEQMPATPPKVTYEDGQLAIAAHNSTLGDILNAVRSQTGAAIEVSSGNTGERVVAQFGPGPARDVLSALLNGSHFNYVMLSAGGNPAGLTRVILTPKPAGPVPSGPLPSAPAYQAAQPVRPGYLPPAYVAPSAYVPPAQAQTPPPAQQNAEEEDSSSDAGEEVQTETSEPATVEQPEQPGNPGAPRTPEQLLQDLQRQQQLLQQLQQRQQQQGQQPQNQPNPNQDQPRE